MVNRSPAQSSQPSPASPAQPSPAAEDILVIKLKFPPGWAGLGWAESSQKPAAATYQELSLFSSNSLFRKIDIELNLC